MSMVFLSLSISGWRQFFNVSFEFHPRLTIITGTNGAGKSTLLNLLTPTFGWQRNLLGTPKKKRKNGIQEFSTGIHRIENMPNGGMLPVGRMTYSNGVEAQLLVMADAQQYNVGIQNQQNVVGTFISSHRPVPVFKQVSQINAAALHPDQAYGIYQGESVQRYQGNQGQGAIFRIKEALISLALFGTHGQLSEGDDDALSYFRGFVEVLRVMLPESLGFQDISIRVTDVILETTSGNFVIDAASGGVMSIIDIAWQIYTFSKTTQVTSSVKFTVVMDEPENHLHPSMQRNLLANLLEAFPTAQFIVATHSPFMVSSVKDSAVYALRYTTIDSSLSTRIDDDEQSGVKVVYSEKLDVVNRAGNASEILRDVLGVPVTVPLWVEEQLNSLVEEFRNREISVESLGELRDQMTGLGFGEMYPSALAKVIGVK